MELIIIVQGILLILLVWRVIFLGNLIERMLKFQKDVKNFQDAQCELNLTQGGINNIFAAEIERMNFVNQKEK